MNAGLRQWQQQFRRGLFERRFPPGLRNGSGAPAEERFGVYAHAYRARLAEALRSNYPVLHRALGDDAFDALAQAYLAAQPSRHASIRWFGDTLESFARGPGEALLPHPALRDLIRLEWALCLAFDAADERVLEGSELAQVAAERWPGLVFAAHPAVRLIRLEWAVEPTWRALNEQPDAETAPPEPAPHATLVWRQGLAPQFRSLEAGEAAALEQLIAGACFGRMCEHAAGEAGDDAAVRVVAWLQRWVVDGVLSARLADVR